MLLSIKHCLALSLVIGLTACHHTSGEKEHEDLDEDGMELAMQQEFKMTRDPVLNIVPKEKLELAKQQADGILAFRTLALTWEERGPSNIGGRTRAIMIDRRDVTGNTVFAASVSGGIFKTTTFNTSPNWTPVNDKMANLAVTCLVQDKNTPTIMYAGTGEGWFNIDGVRGAGVFKSTDGGNTWTQLASTVGFEYVQDVITDNNSNVYVSLRNQSSSNRGVMRSTNGGSTWTQVLGTGAASTLAYPTGRAADLELASNGDLYASLGIFSKSMILKSSASVNGANTGALNTWTDITPVKTTGTQRAEIAVAPSNPQRVYVTFQDSASSQVKTIYRSSDGGNVWDSLPAPGALNNGSVSQNWYNLASAVDPNNADILVIGGFHVVKSIDAGNSFSDITTSGVHVDQHVLVYASSNNIILGNDGGIYLSADGGITFVNRNSGFNVTQFYGADYHPTSSNYFLAGAQDNNTQKFTTPGINTTGAVVGGDGGVPHIDQSDGLIQIAATTGNNFYRSIDGGNNWSNVTGSNSRGQFINPSDYDDVQNTLYSADDPGRYFFINNLGGATTTGSPSISAIGSSREVTAIKVDPFSLNTIWVGTNSTAAGVLPEVLKISNANSSASASVVTFSVLSGVPAGAYISCVDVDPSNGNHILATLSNFAVNSVWESTDGGNSFHSIEGNLPDMPVYWGLFVPANAQLNGSTGGNGGILLGTDLGVWSSSQINGTATVWIPNSTNFPNVRTDMLKLRASDNLVVAATHGRGLFTTTLPTVVTGIPTVDNTKDFIKFTTVDAQKLFIRTGNLGTTKMQIRIFDASGRMVYTADTRYADQSVSIGKLPRSSYVVKVYGNKGERYTRQFVK